MATGKAKSNEGREKKEARKKDFFKFGECLDGEANMKKEVEGRCERKTNYGSLSGPLVNPETFPARKRAVRMEFRIFMVFRQRKRGGVFQKVPGKV
ncbi:MAG: hypothetical protein OSB05_12175 [Akkermansiaceae bacterium]|nr:hypothetical protein [Akkermansiaceae bacterium]